jgi:glucose/arabinose dehydrogenase
MTRQTLIGLVLLAAAAPAAGQVLSDPDLDVETIDLNLSLPTGFTFLGGTDELFVIEKNTGRVMHVAGGVTTPVLDLDVSNESERGLLGIELHPDFAVNNHVYLYYSANSISGDGQPWTENRLSRFTWNGAALTGETTLLQFPDVVGLSDGPNHDAGPIRFGPDGMLYGTTGDLNRNEVEQNFNTGESAGVGGIYRVRDDGTVPDGTQGGETANPFLTEAAAFHKWFAYGVRNTFGMAFDPATGYLWDTENGPITNDEINLVASGFNSGWQSIMGPDDDPGDDGELVMLDGAVYSDPEFTFADTNGVTAIEFLHGSALGLDYDDGVLVGDNNNGYLYLFRLNGPRTAFVLGGDLADLVADDQAEANLVRLGTGFGAITDIRVGPDGFPYVLSLGTGDLYRITPEPATLALVALGGAGLLLRRRRA